MAFASDSTTAPARPLLALVPFATRPAAPVDEVHTPELPPEPLLPAADHARTLHLRRQLAQAAEHGAALLASLGLPRLVGLDHIVVDPVAAGDALDLAIATLDALDGDTDLEPYLAGFYNGLVDPNGEREGGEDELEDDGTSEPSLASPERHPSIPLSFRGHAYTARGGEEGQLRWAEGARHDGELVNEDGDDLDAGEHDTADHESYLGWPEDVAAVTSGETYVLTADPDAEHDDADLEPDDDVTNSGLRLWVFGPSRCEVAHV